MRRAVLDGFAVVERGLPSGAQDISHTSSCCVLLTRRPRRKPWPTSRSAANRATATRKAVFWSAVRFFQSRRKWPA
ncbi:hypothetical protein BM536_022340 [Streptomyces phaeoluteigriseus]|uniref:Uncharacterized protein n=1 Tax=Streptomyces phaeoluteigriseus TaxID=114686 RepID=A0A1V6MQM7_9ACTN|nr:hypothetical protein BM536_022340 [Streptomyces phaeoluteigriseus]